MPASGSRTARSTRRSLPRSDETVPAPAVLRTRTGKKLEVPVKRLLQGRSLGEVWSTCRPSTTRARWGGLPPSPRGGGPPPRPSRPEAGASTVIAGEAERFATRVEAALASDPRCARRLGRAGISARLATADGVVELRSGPDGMVVTTEPSNAAVE